MEPTQRRLPRARAALRPHMPLLIVAALVTWASWPVLGNLEAAPDLDGAWQLGLRMALHDGLDFGTDVVFTYGPLGFLQTPLLVYPWGARLALVWGLLEHFTLCVTLVWGLRRALGSLPLAGLAAVLIAALIFQEPAVVIGFTAAVVLAAGLAGPRGAPLIAGGLGFLAGVELLMKINTGITLSLLAVAALAAAPAARRHLTAIFFGAAAVTVVFGWLTTGQAVGAFDDYIRNSLSIISGYSEAMTIEFPDTAWEYWAALVVVAIGFVVAHNAGALLPRRSARGLLVLWALLAFMSFKSGFVRHDAGHANIFWASTLGGLIAFGWASHRRSTPVLIGLLMLFGTFASLKVDPGSFVAPFERAKALVNQTRTLTDGSATNEGIARGRGTRAAVEAFPPDMFQAANGIPAHIDPVDAGLAWSQRLPWRPLPVFQSYTAYTRHLDDLNADALRSRDGPPQVVREKGISSTIDGRNPSWESPAAMLAMLCHFRATHTAEHWQRLVRSAPRCGKERLLRVTKAKLGAPAPIPPAPDAGSVVFVRIDGIAVGGLEKIRTALYRAKLRMLTFDGNRSVRLIPGTAENGHVLRVPKRADFPAPFGLDQNAKTMTVTRGTGTQDGEVSLRFLAMPIR